MPTDLRWVANRSVSCFHAMEAIVDGKPLVIEATAEVLADPAQRAAALCQELALPVDRFFGHLVPLSLGFDSHTQLAQLTLKKLVGATVAEQTSARLAAIVLEAKSAYAAAFPDLLDELELRGRPLRELWEARGPGMLAGVARQLEPGVLVSSADVLLVQPVLGGGGTSHLAYNSARIEAVLANPHADLPEVVRLAWLLAPLNLDLPKFSEHLSPASAGKVLRLAVLPAVLASAHDVELIGDPDAMLPRAVELWQLGDSQLAEQLGVWWKTYRDSRPPLPVALAALERLISNATP
jgi:hypothetical protein